MATGILKNEQSNADALTALNSDEAHLPLPAKNTPVQLLYKNKSPVERILENPEIGFKKFESKNKTITTSLIQSNSFALCDNYYGLHSMIENNQKATLFYLDPPYGTGMGFQSRELEHAYKDNMDTAAYVEFMRRRLILMRECLTDDGSIYIHIGHQMLAHIKLLMDEIFGSKNFRNLITRRKCSSKNFTRKQYSNLNDFLIFYSKSSHYKWNQPGISPDEDWINKEYTKIDEYGRKFKLVPIHAPGTRNGETGKRWEGKLPPPGKHWQYTPSKLDELNDCGDMYWSKNGNPRRKVYWSTDKKLTLSDYWSQYRDAHHQSIKITGYPTEKNFEMLKMIVGASSDKYDLVVDPFCGCGTTLDAARVLDRNWIGFDSSFTAAKFALTRLKFGTAPMGDYVNKKTAKNIRISEINEIPPNLNFVVESELFNNHTTEVKELAKLAF